MRGRSLVRASSSQPVCAFCAHLLRATHNPSYLQLRQLHSTQPAPTSAGEASAASEDDGAQIPPATWGRSVSSGARSGMLWGRPKASVSTSTTQGSDKETDHDQSTKPTRTDYGEDLLPHERRARDLLLEQQHRRQQEEQELARRKTLSGPELTRAGRYIPRSEEKRREEEGRSLARDRARISYDKVREIQRQRVDVAHQNERDIAERAHRRYAEAALRSDQVKDHIEAVKKGIAGPRIIRSQILPRLRASHAVSSPDTLASDQDRTWGQLRQRVNRNAEEVESKPDDRFSQGRALREEQSKFGRYTPLGSNSGSNYNTRQDNQRWPDQLTSNKDSESQFTHRVEYSREDDKVSSPKGTGPQLQHHASAYADAISTYTPPSQAVPTERLSRRQPRTISVTEFPRNEQPPVDQSVAEEKSGREKKAKKRRGGDDTVEAFGKGKAKDKARRREQFVRTPEEEQEALKLAQEKLDRRLEKAAKKAAQAEAPTPILLPQFITVANLAVALGVNYEQLATRMMDLGFEESHHDLILDSDNAGMVALEYDFDPIFDRGEEEDLKARDPPADPTSLPQRPPVVTIMGHVDHGKTTLLDWLRKSSVAATEHGGITQHIGAFSVPMPSGKIITFLDTPGHAAFLSMRQRGANVTDIVILVVAADDSVKPQTIEAINHAKAARVPMIVAINKIDKDDIDIERVKADLARNGVEIEDFGGDTQVVLVSGKTGQGMQDLEETAVALSEILDMRAEKDGPVEGWVLEASIKSVGKVATVLMRRGTIRPGDYVVAGNTWARVRVLRNEAGVEIDEAGPGMPVEVDGWREQPLAGDEVLQAPDEAKAKSVVDYRLEKVERDRLAEDMVAINIHRKEDFARQKLEKAEAEAAKAAKKAGEAIVRAEKVEKAEGPKQVYFIVKGDVSGSVEAVLGSLATVGTKEVEPHILRSGVGQVSEFDIEHAAAAKGHVISFNTIVEPHIVGLAEAAKVKIIEHKIIYALVDSVKAELSTHLPPLVIQKVVGEAEVAKKFDINVKGRQYAPVAGCKVRNGTVSRNSKVRVLRDGEKVFDGTLSSLKQYKKDATEVTKGNECGLGFLGWDHFQTGDQIQAYTEREEKRYL